MKRLLIAAASVALLVSPTFAQQAASEGAASASAGPGPACPAIPHGPVDHPCPPTDAAKAGQLSLSGKAEEVTGTITTIDFADGAITLDNGKVFAMQRDVALNNFEVGQSVTISYMNQDGKLIGSGLKKASPAGPPAPGAPEPEYR